MLKILPTDLIFYVSVSYEKAFLSDTYHDSDSIIEVSIWSTVEPGIGITAGCIATLRPLFQTVMWRLGLAPAPSYAETGPIPSLDGTSNVEHRLGWFRPTHRVRSIEHIESALSTTTTTITGPSTPKRKSWFSIIKSRTNE